MIVLTRLNGKAVALNPDLICRVEVTPDTVVTLVDDKKFLVEESLAEVIGLITDYRAYVIARSNDLRIVDEGIPTLHVVPNEMITSPGSGVNPNTVDVFDPEGDDDPLGGVLDFPANKEGF
ncbi:MAG: flagellar FlbD family protein [Actinomycetota bacterium]